MRVIMGGDSSIENGKYETEVEVAIGEFVYLSRDIAPYDTPHSLLCSWEKLPQDQKDRFQEVHSELMQIVRKIQVMFAKVPQSTHFGECL